MPQEDALGRIPTIRALRPRAPDPLLVLRNMLCKMRIELVLLRVRKLVFAAIEFAENDSCQDSRNNGTIAKTVDIA